MMKKSGRQQIANYVTNAKKKDFYGHSKLSVRRKERSRRSLAGRCWVKEEGERERERKEKREKESKTTFGEKKKRIKSSW